MTLPLVDIHCHLLPGVDDGAPDLATALEMARMAAADGTRTMILTPHQLGKFAGNRGDDLRRRTAEFQRELTAAEIPITVLPGGDVRIDDNLPALLQSGEVLTLGDRRRHVLLELPHEFYLPLEGLLELLRRQGIVGILSHPERNAGLLARPEITATLVDAGCLMQVTAGSFIGAFGPNCQRMAEWMLAEGLIHFIATDAHGVTSRRPRLSPAVACITELADEATALDLCSRLPGLVAAGQDVPAGRRAIIKPKTSGGWRRFVSRVFSRAKATG
jgi:protein-tyrosine phosphatase